MKEVIHMIFQIIMGAVIGGGLGFLYQKKVGCKSGTCPITSNPYISTVYGAVMGILVSTSF